MNIRPAYASQFYAGDIPQQIDYFLKDFKSGIKVNNPIGGVVPHAGWYYSGATAAKVFSVFKDQNPSMKTFILLGTVHDSGKVRKHSVFSTGEWETPLGPVQIDEILAEEILEASDEMIEVNHQAHDWEHSIEVQVPIIKYLFPDAKILPIAVPPINTSIALGEKIAGVLSEYSNDVSVVASTDLTHYGSNYGFEPAGSGDAGLDWMHKNDERIVNLAVNLESDKIIDEVSSNRNACGPGALSAAVSYAKKRGCKEGQLLEYITSHEVAGEDKHFTLGVGYAGIIFQIDQG